MTIPDEVKDSFQVGKYVKFIDLLGHAHESWDMDPIEFKILQNYVGKTAKIIDVFTHEGVPDAYNLFVTVVFKDGYTLYDASYYAFGPPEFKIYDFEKERLRRLSEESN